MSKNLTQFQLKTLLNYDPLTGIFTCKFNNSRKKIGDEAGHKKGSGHIAIGIKGEVHLAHRLAFLYMDDRWPDGPVRHMDEDTSNNKWENIFDLTKIFDEEKSDQEQANIDD